MAEKGPKIYVIKLFTQKKHLSIFLTIHVMRIETTMHIMAYHGSQDKIDDICRNWQPLISACFPSWSSRSPGRQWQEMARNGFPRRSRVRREISLERQKNQVSKVTPQTPTLGVSRVFESFEDGVVGATLAENGGHWFPRRSRHSPTTNID